jgi:MFS family permease
LFLANLAVLVFSWLSGDQFLVWGWRIPFLLSIIMVGVGLWIRLGILETPVFQKVLDEARVERVPVLQVLKRQPKEVALTALLRLPEQAPGYLFGAFIFTYGTVLPCLIDACLADHPPSRIRHSHSGAVLCRNTANDLVPFDAGLTFPPWSAPALRNETQTYVEPQSISGSRLIELQAFTKPPPIVTR